MKIAICGIPDGTFSCEKTAVKKRLPRSMPRRAFLSFTWSCSMSWTWKRNQIAKKLAIRPNGWLYKIILLSIRPPLSNSFNLAAKLQIIKFHNSTTVTPDFYGEKNPPTKTRDSQHRFQTVNRATICAKNPRQNSETFCAASIAIYRIQITGKFGSIRLQYAWIYQVASEYRKQQYCRLDQQGASA